MTEKDLQNLINSFTDPNKKNNTDNSKLAKYLSTYLIPSNFDTPFIELKQKIINLLQNTKNFNYKNILEGFEKNIYTLTDLKLIYTIIKLSEINTIRDKVNMFSNLNNKNFDSFGLWLGLSNTTEKFDDEIIKLKYIIGTKLKSIRDYIINVNTKNTNNLENLSDAKYFANYLADRLNYLEKNIIEVNQRDIKINEKNMRIDKILEIETVADLIIKIIEIYENNRNINDLESVINSNIKIDICNDLHKHLNIKCLVKNLVTPINLSLTKFLIEGEIINSTTISNDNIYENSFFIYYDHENNSFNVNDSAIPFFIRDPKIISDILEIGSQVKLLNNILKYTKESEISLNTNKRTKIFFGTKNHQSINKKKNLFLNFDIHSKNFEKNLSKYKKQICEQSNEKIYQPLKNYLDNMTKIFLNRRDDFFSTLLKKISDINQDNMLSKRSLTRTVNNCVKNVIGDEYINDIDIVFLNPNRSISNNNETNQNINKNNTDTLNLSIGNNFNTAKSYKNYDYIVLTITPSYPYSLFINKNTILILSRFFNIFLKMKRTEERLISILKKKFKLNTYKLYNLLINLKFFIYSEVLIGLDECFNYINNLCSIVELNENIERAFENSFRRCRYYDIKKIINGIEEICVSNNYECFLYAMSYIDYVGMDFIKNFKDTFIQ